eukprot:s5105_g6.t1
MDSATPSCGILQVTVSDLKAEVLGVFHLEADASEVAAVRRQLEVSRSIPNFEVHLVCHGRVLQDADLLCEFEKDGYVEITLLRSPQPCAVTGGSDGDFLVWDLRSGSCCRFLPVGETITCLSIDWSARVMLSGHADSTLRLWDLDRGVCLRVLTDASTQVLRCVEFSWNAKLAVSGCAAFGSCCSTPNRHGTTLALWDLASGRHIQGFGACGVRSLSVDWTSHVLVNDDARLHLFSLDSGSIVWQTDAASALQAMAVDWPAQRAVSAGSGTIKVWKLDGPRCIQEFTGCAHVQEIAVDTCFATLFSAVLVAVHGCAGACGSFQCSYGCGGCAVTGATVSMQILLQLIVVVVLLVLLVIPVLPLELTDPKLNGFFALSGNPVETLFHPRPQTVQTASTGKHLLHTL